ncbi:unnamed protein product [Phytophthora fragariaefolia]|uniref:Unnamed protein product n=1 Tax=Phytophthora fragariaefolia TaxID=1490495 RepID=A0A9W7D3N6_9STRA|nr:unnamed protein product [Phytophthora fragariaefolia]
MCSEQQKDLYYEDSHMQTPNTLKGRNDRYAEFYDAADEAKLGRDDSDEGRDNRESAEDSAKDGIRRLSLDDAERDRDHYLEVCSHASLDKIAEFEGKRYRSDDSLQWLRRFIYEMEGDKNAPGLVVRTLLAWSSARPQVSSTVQWNSANQPVDTTSRANRFTDRRDNYGRRGDSRERPQYGRVHRVATRGTQCTSVASAANFVSKRPPGPLRAEQFKLGGPPIVTGLDEGGLPQSAEPGAEAKYIFAYVGKAGRPERVWMDGNDGTKMDGIDGELGYAKEESRAMISNAGATRLRKGAMGMAKRIKLLSGERLGCWSAQKFDRRVRMRALVMGAVNDQRTKILLDTGANISAINATFARKLRLKRQASRDVQIGVQGIGKDKVGTSTRAWVKITLGWEVSYEFEVWVMDHHAGVDLILGTDFMIPAGIRLDLYNSLAKLPDEVVVPLIKSLNSADDPKGGLQITGGPAETICLPGRATAEFRARRKQPVESTHELWGLDGPVVSLTRDEAGSSRVLASAVNSTESATNDLVAPRVEKWGNPPDRGRQTGEISVSDDKLDVDPEKNLHLRYLLAAELDNDKRGEGEPGRHDDVYERVPNSLALEDYAHELAFLPDLTDVRPTQLDYSADNVVCSAHSAEQTTRLLRVLQSHEQIMISSGNALPPPAYGVVCDIDVQGHPPIQQRARRVPLKHLKKRYEQLKALLKAGLIPFSNSPWASPIVIVLKKNGVDIRLCIDYKLVNAITLMEYAIPLVDDLLTELDAYLWFCSLDAASGLWAVMMTRRARRVSAFVCALGHFKWLRMPLGLNNAPMIYHRLIDNALWGYVQPKGGWEAFAERIRRVEIEAEAQRVRFSTYAEFEPTRLTKFDADRRALAESDPTGFPRSTQLLRTVHSESGRVWGHPLSDKEG